VGGAQHGHIDNVALGRTVESFLALIEERNESGGEEKHVLRKKNNKT
jgi:hypothetical protein